MRFKSAKLLRLILSASLLLPVLTSCGQSGGKPSEESSEPKQNGPLEAPGEVSLGTPGEVSAYDTENSDYTLTIDAGERIHEISDMLFGIFIEDINFAADGGLYAEMVQNRSFEFTSLAQGNEKHGWSDLGAIDAQVAVADMDGCLNGNNTNYLIMTNASDEPAGVANRGFLDGMAVTEETAYEFSVWAKGLEGFTGPLSVDITVNGESAARGEIPALTDEWAQYKLELTSGLTAHSGVNLEVTMGRGKAALDMVSLFPKDTFKGRENGLRQDLAEKLEALEPRFLRFPGGCVVEGWTLEDAFNWKDSIGVDENGDPMLWNGHYGDVAVRRQGVDLWSNPNTRSDPNPSFMSYGLGFYEYFLLAEDIGAVGVPVLNCGMACMVRGNAAAPLDSDEMKRFIQDALDLVEFCRGGEDTKWGAVRISMGHPDPFELKYIGIGNEQWGSNYFRHYEAFLDAFAKAREERPELYEGVELMFSAGTDDGDSGYGMYIDSYRHVEDWLADNPGKTIADYTGAIDHHYYNTPDWFLSHANYYDEANYTRATEDFAAAPYGGGMPVFLGEYAAQSNTLNAALAEAAYMTGLERNGDIVKMASYAPLFGNLTALHWAPDLIWFDNHQVTCSVNYYVQQIFAKNAGTTLLRSDLTGAEMPEDSGLTGKIGVGTWNTGAEFDNVKIVNNDTGEALGEQDFETDTLGDWSRISDGNWSVEDGRLVQSNTSTNTNAYATTGSAMYFGDSDWSNYTLTLDAVKTGGAEGFLIPFAVRDKDNNFFWNLGGWNNTVSTLQQVSGGSKSDQIGSTTKPLSIKTGQTYHLKIVVTPENVKCYVDDTLYVDYTPTPVTKSEAYEVVSTDETGDIIIKLVNVTGEARTFAIDLKNAILAGDTASVDRVAGDSLQNDNVLGREPVVTLETSSVSGIKEQFNYTVPAYSVTVLRIGTK